MLLSQVQQDIISILKKANHVLVLPSSPIDGDCLGSALALYLALNKLGKQVTVVAEEKIPANYNFLPEVSAISDKLEFVRDFIVTIDCRDEKPKNVRQEIQGNKINIIVTPEKQPITKEQVSFEEGAPPYDCIVTVDAADTGQLGKIYENFTEIFQLVPVINIDHHASNNSFGKFNLVDVMASATTVLVLPLIEALGVAIDADIATLLLAGLITDTSSFQNPNTTPDAFAIAAKLIGYGARQQEIIRNIYKTKKLSTLRLWGRTLTKIQNDEKYKIVWSVLTAKDFAELGGSADETEGVIDELMSNAPNAEIIFLLREKSPQESSCSIRTLSPAIDASRLAEIFGGGGHMQAAGFKIKEKNIEEAEKYIIDALRDFQKKRLRIFDNSAAERAPYDVLPATQHATPVQSVTMPLPQPPESTMSYPPAPQIAKEPPMYPISSVAQHAPAPEPTAAVPPIQPASLPWADPLYPAMLQTAPAAMQPQMPPAAEMYPQAPAPQLPPQFPEMPPPPTLPKQTPPEPPSPQPPPRPLPRIPGSTFPTPPGIE